MLINNKKSEYDYYETQEFLMDSKFVLKYISIDI